MKFNNFISQLNKKKLMSRVKDSFGEANMGHEYQLRN